MNFTTFDNDNDKFFIKTPNGNTEMNCAVEFGGGGGNWWNRCGKQNMNGKYGGKNNSGLEYMYWRNFDNNNEEMALKSMTLMFRQAD